MIKLRLIPYTEGEIKHLGWSLKDLISWRTVRSPRPSKRSTSLSGLIAERLGKRSPDESDAAREAWKALQAPKRRDAPLARPIAVRWVGPQGDPKPDWGDDDIPF